MGEVFYFKATLALTWKETFSGPGFWVCSELWFEFVKVFWFFEIHVDFNMKFPEQKKESMFTNPWILQRIFCNEATFLLMPKTRLQLEHAVMKTFLVWFWLDVMKRCELLHKGWGSKMSRSSTSLVGNTLKLQAGDSLLITGSVCFARSCCILWST